MGLNPGDIPVAILAGGLASRMRPLTEKIPKVLLTVGDKPFLEHQLAMLREQGIRRIVLCVGYLGELIQEQFGDGSSYGVELLYSFDGPVLLGTGGAIRQALSLLGEVFFVMYGDSYLTVDLLQVARALSESRKSAVMTVFDNRNRWDVSNVWFADGQIKSYDKQSRIPEMRHIDYGLSAFHSSVFSTYPSGVPLDLASVLKDLVAKGDLAGYEASQRFYEIGSPSGLQELDQFLRRQGGNGQL
jgi:NDP-sugar pyrophosphorylase family protein